MSIKTPLRYPGGKQKLAPFILEVMEENDLVGGEYAEPYAGGAGVALELLSTGKASKVHLNDSSKALVAFWRSVLSHTDELCRLITAASLTVSEWRKQKEIYSRPSEFSRLELGFAFFYLNRCNRSGIPTGGLIGGVAQNGPWKMDARFPRGELVRRIELVASFKKSIVIKNLDAETFIAEHLPTLPPKSLIYCDPPYFQKADRLYPNHYAPDDHSRISNVIQGLKLPWVTSYDGIPEILKLYAKRKSFLYDLQYNAARAYKGKEVFIFSDMLKLPKKSVITSIDLSLQELQRS